MKKIALIIAMLGLSAAANAGPVNVESITATGTVHNPLDRIIDGSYPNNREHWNASPNVWWNGLAPVITLTFDGLYLLNGSSVAVDNNDYYRIEVSVDNIVWETLYQITSPMGSVNYGMETFNSDWGSFSFSPTLAQYARIYAYGGDNSYSVGELSFSGDLVPQSVPEPGILSLAGLAMLGLFGLRKTKKN